MTLRILSFLTSAALFGASAHAQLQRIVLQGSGEPQVFTDINAALVAAQANDLLYLSGGSFSGGGELVIDKPLHFIGAGVSPDSSSVTGTTTIATTNAGNSGHIIITSAASGSTFTGIRFDPQNYIQYGTSEANDDPVDLVFERCVFDARVITGFSGGTSSTVFNECVFHGYLYGTTGVTALLTRCILDFQAGTGAEVSGFDNGLTMRFCVGLGTRVGNSENVTIENCVFTRTSAPVWQSNGATLTNNLCVSPSLTSNMTAGAATGNVLGVVVSEIFVDESNTDFEWTDDLHLQATSVGIGMANDGTNVGIYGSNSPFKAGAVPHNPHFRSAVLSPATNANGELPVNIHTVAQPN
ncbi:MAG: hypothetical protein IPN44_13165 [Flavobacteriales bacterium]|nr:hypothetical protein [Flavobacteriales bacterium]